MFMHLGKDYIIPAKDIIAIIDVKTGYLKDVKKDVKIIKISKTDAKSYIITDKNIYASPISAMTLRNRLGSWEEAAKIR